MKLDRFLLTSVYQCFIKRYQQLKKPYINLKINTNTNHISTSKFITYIISFSFCISFLNINPVYASVDQSSHYSIGADYATGRVIDLDNTSQVDGTRVTLGYTQDDFWWHQFQLLFEANAAYYHSTYAPLHPGYHDNLWIVAAAPIARYHFLPNHPVDLYADLSVGPGYLSTTRFENRNLGIHYTFQDMVALGALFGTTHEYSLGVRVIHYSNGGLSSHNRGFTIPVIVSFSYQFC